MRDEDDIAQGHASGHSFFSAAKNFEKNFFFIPILSLGFFIFAQVDVGLQFLWSTLGVRFDLLDPFGVYGFWGDHQRCLGVKYTID